MDETKSRKSDVTATRKRRSSILKNQRPPRTPFSELEFNVATPSDNAKSRRVSFSRRNGVAEFEITEATTAWKNVYEEHNKCLESSVNDSDVKGENKPRVLHLGSRIADIDFEDAEADIINTTGAPDQLIVSFSADNQECTNDDRSLSAPHGAFDVSEFTNQKTNQLFGPDDNPMMKEITDQIDVNFSVVAPLSDDNFEMMRDDLDQEKKGNFSSYVSVDLNATQFSFKSEESAVSDMSITDSIHSPKVDASKITLNEKKASVEDWVADKENIVMNPYVAPLPAENFAVSDDCDEVLVFDGKKCKYQSDLDSQDLLNPPVLALNTETSKKRRTIVFNDDAGDISVTQVVEAQIILPPQDLKPNSRKTVCNVEENDSNISMTQGIPTNIINLEQPEGKCKEQNAILFDDLPDISMTQALPSNILGQKNEDHRKIIDSGNDDSHVSVTETIPANMPQVVERRKTILFDNDNHNGDISITQAVPTNVMNNDKRDLGKEKTIVYDNSAGCLDMTQAVPINAVLTNEVFDNDTENISMNEPIHANIIQSNETDVSKIKKIVFESNAGNFSITQTIPGNLILANDQEVLKRRTLGDLGKEKTIVYDNSAGCLDMTQAVPVNVVLTNEVFDNDTENISMTEPIRDNIIQSNETDVSKRKTIVFESNAGNISVTQTSPSNLILANDQEALKRRTLVNENDAGNISVTEAVPAGVILPNNPEASKRRTIFYENDAGNISVTQVVPANLTLPNNPEANKRRTMVYENDEGNISVTQAVPANLILSNNTEANKRRTMVYENDEGNISVTQAVPANLILSNNTEANKRRTMVYENDEGNISVTEAVPAGVILPNNPEASKRRTIFYENDAGNISVTQVVPANLTLPNNPEANKRRTMVYENDEGNISVTEAVPAGVILPNNPEASKRRTIFYENDAGNISVTQVVPANLTLLNNPEANKRRTMVYENDEGNISVTQAVPANLILSSNTEASKRRTNVYENDVENISVTQAITGNDILRNTQETNKRGTIVFEDDRKNITLTKSLPSDLRLPNNEKINDGESIILRSDKDVPIPDLILLNNSKAKITTSIIFQDCIENVSVTQAIATNLTLLDKSNVDKMRTFTNDGHTTNISATQMVSNNVSLQELQDRLQVLQDNKVNITTTAFNTDEKSNEITNKRSSIAYHDQKNMSMTQSGPPNISRISSVTDKKRTKNDNIDIPNGQSLLANLLDMSNDEYDVIPQIKTKTDITPELKVSEIQKTVLYADEAISLSHMGPSEIKIRSLKKPNVYGGHDEPTDMLITQAIPQQGSDLSNRNVINSDERLGNVSMTKPIPAEMISIQSDIEGKPKVDKLDRNYTAPFNDPIIENKDILIYEAIINMNKHTDPKSNDSKSESFVSYATKTNSAATISRNSIKSQIFEGTNVSLSVDDVQEPESKLEVDKNSMSESMIENRSDRTKKDVKFVDNPASGKTSVLNDLLDMSDACMEDDKESKDSMIKLISDGSSTAVGTLTGEKGSQESYLLIKDSDEDQVAKNKSVCDAEISVMDDQEPLAVENQEEKRHGIVGKIQQKLGELKSLINHKTSPSRKTSPKRKHVKVMSSELENVAECEELDKTKNWADTTKTNKTVNNADDTNALLNMLSELTDSRVMKDFTREDQKEVAPITYKGHIAIEDKTEVHETRGSLVVDINLPRDISMAQAVMGYRFENMEESGDDTATGSQEEMSVPHNNLVRISNDVVKTLKFDEDDTIHEISSHREMAASPLKKTAFGETTNIEDSPDNKTKVIPCYLKDVSYDIKQLMDDLVKPMADAIPFDTRLDKGIHKSVSTCSTQIQANLLTSSQIDIDPELVSNVESMHSAGERLQLASEIAGTGNKFIAKTLSESNTELAEMEIDSAVCESPKFVPTRKPNPDRVLFFDHQNPLNNVMLPPIDHAEVHKYNPIVPRESLIGPEPSDSTQESVPLSVTDGQQKVESRIALHNLVMSGDSSPTKIGIVESITSDASKTISVSQSVNAIVQDLKDTEVNTVIVMKKNRDLLKASSSLTLVDDDALGPSSLEVDKESQSPSPTVINSSPVKVIFKINEQESSVKLESDLTSCDDEISEVQAKGKKRSHSPSRHRKKHCTFANEGTPKSSNKLQKFARSTKTHQAGTSILNCDRAQQFPNDTDTEMYECPSRDSSRLSQEDDKQGRRKVKSSLKNRKPGTAVTVGQLMTEYDMVGIDQGALSNQIMEVLSAKTAHSEISGHTEEPVTASVTQVGCYSLDVVSSFNSGRDLSSAPSVCGGLASERSEAQGWQPELVHEMSSKNLITEGDSSVNVVAKIDVLPFMGTSECEWESRGADLWSFRLLRARLRLVVRLEHRHDNAARTCVRADTPVRTATVEILPRVDGKHDPLVSLCVRFAADAIRYFSAGCTTAGDVPAVLRRCAGVARTALRWGRAMHAARMHLAYTLTDDGDFSLKVANIPLRSVWEVTMRISTVVSDAHSVPWPRADRVRIARVVAKCDVPADTLARLLATVPEDWGHVPRTVWKLFKYLKHKTSDEDFLLCV